MNRTDSSEPSRQTLTWRAARATGIALALSILLTAPSRAAEIAITVTGTVEFNSIGPAPLGTVNPGDPVELTFTVDSDVFVDSASFPVRGYTIDPTSFSMVMGSVTVGLQDPLPMGETAYFSIRNDDPAVDGFMLTNIIASPNGVALDVTGVFGQFRDNFYVTYTGDTLTSHDILEAVGTYDYTGLTVFNWTINDGAFEPLGISFEQLVISGGPAPVIFLRGDCNEDGTPDIADAVALLSTLFPPPGGPVAGPVSCEDACDGNDDGIIDISDAISILSALFGSPPIPLPEPAAACGEDPTPDALPCATPPSC